jgi:hypothetical protein
MSPLTLVVDALPLDPAVISYPSHRQLSFLSFFLWGR